MDTRPGDRGFSVSPTTATFAIWVMTPKLGEMDLPLKIQGLLLLLLLLVVGLLQESDEADGFSPKMLL